MRIKQTTVLLSVLVVACGGSEDKCLNVVCDQPPADECKDQKTLIVYKAQGKCNPASGKCEYGFEERSCTQGCQEGKCLGEQKGEGYIFVYEKKGGWGEQSGIQAYFAEDLHRRKIPGFLEVSLLQEQQRDGDCAFYLPPKSRALRLEMCQPPCGGDQYCNGTECVDYPTHWNAGDLEFSGLNQAVTVKPDQYDNYQLEGLAADLFSAGAEIKASARGGELAAFEIISQGVAPLQVSSETVSLKAGQAVTISWTPADSQSRVQLFLRAGIHWPALPAALVCDASDSQGQITISAALVDAFLRAASVVQQTSDIMRYQETKKTVSDIALVFRVASVVQLGLELP